MYIGTIPLAVADLRHPQSTRDNLQLVVHPMRDINYKTRRLLHVPVVVIRLVIIHPRLERRI